MAPRKQTNNVYKHPEGGLLIDVTTTTRPNDMMRIDEEGWKYLKSLGIGRVMSTGVSKNGTSGPYACAKIKCKRHKIHRLLLPDSEVVDHINHNGLDNRSANIRACTARENCQNKRRAKEYSSRFPGVQLIKGKFQVKALRFGKQVYLGRFGIEESAALAYRIFISKLPQYSREKVNA